MNHPHISNPRSIQSEAMRHTAEQSRHAMERRAQTARIATEARRAHEARANRVEAIKKRLLEADAEARRRERLKEKERESPEEAKERERLERELKELRNELTDEEQKEVEARTAAERAEQEAEEAEFAAEAAGDMQLKDQKTAAQSGPYGDLTLVPPGEMNATDTSALDPEQVKRVQTASNTAPGIAASSSGVAGESQPGPSGQYASASEAINQYGSVTPRELVPVLGKDGPRTTNLRRNLALAGLGTVVTGLAGSLGYMIHLYLSCKNEAANQPLPKGLPPDREKELAERIKGWLKATANDADFWEQYARLALDAQLTPPLTLTDHILFCSYAIDYFPVQSFLFDSAEDVTLHEMHLVAAYAADAEEGKAPGKGAAAMYRKVTTLKYSAGGKPEEPFPRQVQALLLRRAFVSLSIPSPAVELMALAVEWAEDATLADAEYWKKFSDYRSGAKNRPPLTLRDEMQFCSYTAALQEDTGFYFERKETAPDFIARLVAAYDAQTRSTAGLYTLAPALFLTAGTPLPRRVQAQLLRAALEQLEIKDSGTGLASLVQKWASKSDVEYWDEFVKYKQAAQPALSLIEEMHFCTHTLRQFPVPAEWVALTPDVREGYVTRLIAEYQNGSTTAMYTQLPRLTDRPPNLPRAVQAQVMRLALMQIADGL